MVEWGRLERPCSSYIFYSDCYLPPHGHGAWIKVALDYFMVDAHYDTEALLRIGRRSALAMLELKGGASWLTKECGTTTDTCSKKLTELTRDRGQDIQGLYRPSTLNETELAHLERLSARKACDKRCRAWRAPFGGRVHGG